MTAKYVKIKNKSTGLFWYGFGEPVSLPSQFDFEETKLDDREEPVCTWFDLNVDVEKEYLLNNVNPLEHEYIEVTEEEKALMEANR
jgi:hypothetical protein